MARTIAVDFDGTMHPYTKGWNDGQIDMDEGPLDPGGLASFLDTCFGKGWNVAVFTTRARTYEGFRDVEAWILKWLPKQAIMLLSDAPAGEDRFFITPLKVPAVAYVDDRAVVYRGSWSDAMTDVNHLVEHGPWGEHQRG